MAETTREHDEHICGGNCTGPTTAQTSAATVVMRGDEIARFAEMLRDAVQQGTVHLCVDTTGEEPIISVWAGEEYVSEVPVAGVVFE